MFYGIVFWHCGGKNSLNRGLHGLKDCADYGFQFKVIVIPTKGGISSVKYDVYVVEYLCAVGFLSRNAKSE